MKRILSIFMALVLAFGALSVPAFATTPTYNYYDVDDGIVTVRTFVDGIVYSASYYEGESGSDTCAAVNFVYKDDPHYVIKDKVYFEQFGGYAKVTHVSGNKPSVYLDAPKKYRKRNNNNVKELTIPDTVKNLYWLKDFKNLETVNVGKGVKKIENCFINCPKLKTINISKENKKFIFENGRILSPTKKTQYFMLNMPKEYTVPKGLVNIVLDTNITEDIKIIRVLHKMNKINGYWLRDLEQFRFSKNARANKIDVSSDSLKYVKYGKTQKTSGKFDFGYKTLKILELPYSITTIDDGAYEHNTKLTKVKLKSKIKTVGEFAFNGCDRLSKVVLNHTKKAPTFKDHSFLGLEGIKFYVKNKTVAKSLKKNLSNSGVRNAKIYYKTTSGKYKLIYKNIK